MAAGLLFSPEDGDDMLVDFQQTVLCYVPRDRTLLSLHKLFIY
jgi:hypothetical protein